MRTDEELSCAMDAGFVMLAAADGLMMAGSSRALLRGEIMPFSRVTLAPLKLFTLLTNLTADWSTLAPPNGRSTCDSIAMFGKDKPTGREFLAIRGIPMSVAEGVHNWRGVEVGRSECESNGIFGTENGRKLPVLCADVTTGR